MLNCARLNIRINFKILSYYVETFNISCQYTDLRTCLDDSNLFMSTFKMPSFSNVISLTYAKFLNWCILNDNLKYALRYNVVSLQMFLG